MMVGVLRPRAARSLRARSFFESPGGLAYLRRVKGVGMEPPAVSFDRNRRPVFGTETNRARAEIGRTILGDTSVSAREGDPGRQMPGVYP